MSFATLSTSVARIVDLISRCQNPKGRTIIAIAGPPASGKTTLAQAVVEQLNRGPQSEDQAAAVAALLSMDGYHFSNDVLVSRNRLHRKGAVDTFDAPAFCAALTALATTRDAIAVNGFDRDRDNVVKNAVLIPPQMRIIVAEGNYLLLSRSPWQESTVHYAGTVFVSAPIDVLKTRLLRRWADQGVDSDTAMRKVNENDLLNAALVLNESQPADLHLNNAGRIKA